MDANEKRLIQGECRELVVLLTHHSDHGAHEQAVDLFTPDGTWIRGGKPFTGRAEMLKSFARGSGTTVIRHFTSNICIEVTDERTATGVTYYIAFNHDPGTATPALPLPLDAPFSLGEWHDRFVRTPAGWRFAHREVKRLFQRAGDR
jgi:SnoaL-like domain